MSQEVSDDSNDSLFGEDDTLGEEACLLHSPAPATPGPAALAFSALLGVSRRPHSSLGGPGALGHSISLGPASPLPGVRRQRQRTLSTNAAISTEREPIIRAPKRTIYTQGRPPWYDSQGQQVEPFVIGVCGGSASGKTTVLIKQGEGSWLLLGEVLTTLELEPDPEPGSGSSGGAQDPCGSCTRCIDACPTDAITPFSVDATRCLSYTTIEHRGAIDRSLHRATGDPVDGL